MLAKDKGLSFAEIGIWPETRILLRLSQIIFRGGNEMANPNFEQIQFDVQDGVALVTLNRPDQMNTWTPVMARELSDAMYECDEDDRIRAVILTGSGGAFCAGADLSGGEGGFTEKTKITRPTKWPYQIGKPVIAAINGAAVGVGITYAMLADIRIAAARAKIGFAMVRRGILPELASHVTVSQVAGFSNAADLLLTGRMMSGEEAKEKGIVSESLEAEILLERAKGIADDIAQNTAPVSVALSKKLLWQNIASNIPQLMETEGKLINWLGDSVDVKEGVNAFFEKREPNWSMSPSRDIPEDLLDLTKGN